MTTLIDIRADHLRIVWDVLRRHLPDGVKVWVFGSRATWATKDSSDLDLALEGDDEIPPRSLAALESAFEDSDLPYAVDVVDVKRIGERFRRIVTEQRVPLPGSVRPSRSNDELSADVETHVSWRPRDVRALIRDGVLVVGDGYRAKNTELSSSGVPFARAGNIADGFRFSAADRFPEDRLHGVGDKTSKPGDVVFTSKGTVGRFAYVRSDTQPFVYSPQLCFWRSLDPEVIDPHFLYCWVRGPEFFRQFKSVASETDMAEYVSLTDQRRMFITLPPLPQQRAIAHILGTLDDKIDLNRRMNATLEAMARALFRSWFVDFDPVRAKMDGRDTGLPKDIADLFPDRLVDSELGGIPDGWRLQPLDSIAHFQNGLALQRFRPLQNGARLPVVKIAQLRSGQPNAGEWASATIKPECTLDDGDVVFSWSGSLLIRTWCGGPAALNQHLFKVTSERYPKWYYLYSTLSHFPEFQRIAADKATTMGHIRRHHLTDALCVVPPDRVIAWVSGILAELLERQIVNDVASRTLAALRDALLPKLVSGEMRVFDADQFLKGSHGMDKPCRSGPVSARTDERRGNDVGNGKITTRVQLVDRIETGILGAPPWPMRASEIVWSRKTAMRHATYRGFSEAQQSTLLDEVMKWGVAHRHHAVLGTESGEPAGSGVCVTSGGRRGILTARHVLSTYGEEEEWRTNLFIGFAPPRDQMIQDQWRRQQRQQNSKGLLGLFEVAGIPLGETMTVVPLQRKDKIWPDPGLPDIAIVVVSDDIEERLRKAAHDEGTAVPEPRWVNLDREDLVSIPCGSPDNEDKMLTGSWLITGLRGERSGVKEFYTEMNGITIDRIYRRSEYEYYGILVDEVGGRRAQSRSWKGTSGGGVWQQRLKPSGWRKIEQFSPPSLTPEDLEPPVLGGIAFFHETRKPARELRGDGGSGTADYRGELYAHRIDGVLLNLIRDALQHGVGMAEMDEYERVGEDASEQGGS